MRRIHRSLIASALLISAVAFGVYCLKAPPHLEQTTLSSLEPLPFAADYEQVPCPETDELKKLIQDFHLDISFQDFTCRPEDTRTLLIKVLKSASQFNFKAPKSWGPEAQEIFSDIAAYLQTHFKRITLSSDPRTSTMVATNPGSGLVELTHRLGELSLIEAVSMLVHEARHIQAPQRGHSRCVAGDMPGTDSACDEVFTTSYEEMASYNFEVAFLSGITMYAPHATPKQKKFAAQKALGLIGTRFNNFRNNSAVFHDVVVALDGANQLQLWHPYLKQWLLLPRPNVNDPILQIRAGNDAFTLQIFTKSGQIYVWSPFENLKPFSSELKNQAQVLDGQRTVISALNNDIAFTFISGGRLKLIYFGEGQGRKIIDYPFLSSETQATSKWNRVLYGHHHELFLLNQSGQIYRKNYSRFEPDLLMIPPADALGPWISGYGGLLYDQLYLVNAQGELYQLIIKNKHGALVDDTQEDSYELRKINLPFQGQLKKYEQGSFGDYYLDRKGNLTFKSQQTTALRQIGQLKIQDFTILKNPVALGDFSELMRPPLSEFATRCKVKKPLWDPIIFRGMGKNDQGQLVFSDLAGNCLKLSESPSGWTDIELHAYSKFDDRLLSNLENDGANFRSVFQILLKDSQGRTVNKLNFQAP